jgi:protein-disulfide isomerase
MDTYKGKIKMVYNEFPLSFHPFAQKAAEAAECANAQGKFWEMHDKMFDSQQIDVPSLKTHAKTLGLDTTKFDTCLDSGAMAGEVSKQSALGSANGVGGTPSFFVNGQLIVGADIARLKQTIEAELAS